MYRRIIFSALALSLGLPAIVSMAAAPSPEQKGLQLAERLDTENAGWKAETSTMELTLINAHGDRTERKMESIVKEGRDDGDKSRIEFKWPADVKGTRMLTWSHKKSDDDQWLFLPALKRVKRISSSNKTGSFMGSEFSYEDLGSQEVEKYAHKWLEDTELDGRKVWKVERIPTDENSGYSKLITFLDKEYKNPLRIEYYDRKGALLKVAAFSGYKQFGKLWRAQELTMDNKQTRKQSILRWKDRRLGVSIDEDRLDSDELDD